VNIFKFFVSLLQKRDLVYWRHLSADISIDTRPNSRSILGRYVDRHSANILVDIGRLSTEMHVGQYLIAKPSTLARRHSADNPTDTPQTLGQLSALFFPYSNCSRLRCPLHLVPALSVDFALTVHVGTIHLWRFSQLLFFSASSLLLQTLWFKGKGFTVLRMLMNLTPVFFAYARCSEYASNIIRSK